MGLNTVLELKSTWVKDEVSGAVGRELLLKLLAMRHDIDTIEAALEVYLVKDHRMQVEHSCYVMPPILDRLVLLGVVDSSATGFMSMTV